nr:MAG TPA: hypothetical protein [Caudoviricetes sp.]
MKPLLEGVYLIWTLPSYYFEKAFDCISISF